MISENSVAVQGRMVEVTRKQIADYESHLSEAHYRKEFIAFYKHNLEELYAALPEGKRIGRGTLGS